MATKGYKTVKDADVQCVWNCQDVKCDEVAIVSPDWYQDNGTPVCPECDTDMEYIRTKVKASKVK